MAKTSRRPRRSSHLYLPGAFELYKSSKEIVLKHIWIFGPLYAVPLVFWIHSWVWAPLPNQTIHLWQRSGGFSSGWPGGPLPSYITFAVTGYSVLWLLMVLVLGTTALIMSQAAQLEGARRRDFDYLTLWRTLKAVGWRMLGLYAVMFVLIVAGLVLLIVPGLIIIRRYLLAPYVMLDERCGIGQAMGKSASLSRINPSSVWGLMGVLFLIGLLNIIPKIGGLLAFSIGGLYSVAPALRYGQLKKLV